MSTVYLAAEEETNRQWAVKAMRKQGICDFEMVKQSLLAEASILKKLKHPGLPEITEVIDRENAVLIIMDYVEGWSLDRIVKEQGPQREENAVDWAKQLCDVLSYLHTRNPPVIYRDMKPSNIIRRGDGRIVLIDFGTAREFKGGQGKDTLCLGTRGYAAPEQYGGRGETDERTDIYGLGATLYFILTGHDPGTAPYEICPIRRWDPRLSPGLERIIQKCTRKNPEERYPSCKELLYDLEHYKQLDREYKRGQNLKWRGFLAVFFIMICTGAGALGFWRAGEKIRENTYDLLLLEGKSPGGQDPEESIENYQKAIGLKPWDGRAYEELLEFFLWENQEVEDQSLEEGISFFSVDEEMEMRKALGKSPWREKSNEEYLRENQKDYEKLAYDLGLAYFYSYQGTGNKASSRKWLQIAAKARPSEKLEDSQIQRAGRLWKIAEYYGTLGIIDPGEGLLVSYRDYWTDLVKILDQELEGNNRLQSLLACQELEAQIAANGSDFRKGGVSREEMEMQIDRIEEALNNMEILESDPDGEYTRKMKDKLSACLDAVREVIQGVYNQENIQKGRGGDYGTDTE
ncbi:MAG TPA: serine/threonine protein kinase [Candidatus Blautia stercoripullorum]|uniref:non-specific serine/threonine protein kinase n=1 Tax=Candidatus Blautia stercoripullorum TaxID=2838502 RepID=A0A9D2RBF8_9FIRM|nr:serine/threonine protein kinase [Candidatus Blautia stercoripullorum]